MTETLATGSALLLAHVLADFLLQKDEWVQNKNRPGPLFLHTFVVYATAAFCLGTLFPAPVFLALLHMATDIVKAHTLPDTSKGKLQAFLWDQAAHVAVISAFAILQPTLWADGYWAQTLPGADILPSYIAMIAGFLIATQAGGYAVGHLMALYSAPAADNGLQGAGSTIGWLERALIFGFVLYDTPEAIGFLIAAKSILRFNTVAGAATEKRDITEYVIIGTLASFGWAFAAAWATSAALEIMTASL